MRRIRASRRPSCLAVAAVASLLVAACGGGAQIAEPGVQ